MSSGQGIFSRLFEQSLSRAPTQQQRQPGPSSVSGQLPRESRDSLPGADNTDGHIYIEGRQSLHIFV